jgi:hypothetical protein
MAEQTDPRRQVVGIHLASGASSGGGWENPEVWVIVLLVALVVAAAALWYATWRCVFLTRSLDAEQHRTAHLEAVRRELSRRCDEATESMWARGVALSAVLRELSSWTPLDRATTAAVCAFIQDVSGAGLGTPGKVRELALPPGEYTGTRDCDALNLAIARAYSDAKHLWDEVGGGFIRMMVERKSDGSPSVALRGESEGGG